jgi:tetratricopeptide (TPR) repeat protein
MMRNPARVTLLFTLLFSTAGSAFAQSAADFYVSLLRRGASSVEAGQYDAAATPLRIAAFGLVETVDNYQTALAYLAIAQDRLGNNDGARDSIRRLVAAERVEKKFAALALPANVRGAFDTVAKKHLTPADASALATGGTVATPPVRTQPVTTTRPAQSTQQQTSAQQPPTPTRTQTQNPPPQTKPQTTTTQPPSTQPAKPQTQPQTQPATTPAKPEPAPATTKPATTPAQTTTSAPPKTIEAKPVETKPAPPVVKPPAPQPAPAQSATTTTATKQPLSAKDVASRIAAAERALTGAQLAEARKLYNEVLTSPGLDRESLLRVVEGLYRARDFGGALTAFKNLGTLKRGEEPYGYYHAVALYETGQYDAAKKILAAAIPFIEMTPDVVRYRTKIDGAR